MIYARKGEMVTCRNGHSIVQIARDVQYDDVPVPSDFTNWQQDEPKFGDPVPACAICGAAFAASDLVHGSTFHFDDGWRPLDADPAWRPTRPPPGRLVRVWRRLTGRRTS